MKLGLLLLIMLLQRPLPRADTGVITGVLRHPDGRPASGVRVAAMATSDAAIGAGKGSTLVAISETDSLGRYRLENVPADNYYILAGRVDAPTYYPGTPNISAAASIAVRASGEVTGIDFVVSGESTRPAPRSLDPRGLMQQLFPTLLPAQRIQGTGRILLEEKSNAKLPDRATLNARSVATVRVGITSTPLGNNSSLRIPVASDGTFTFELPAGDLRISIAGLPEGYSVKSIMSGSTDLTAQPLSVVAGMPELVVTLTADLRPRFRVAGRVLNGSTGRPLIGDHIELADESGLIARIIIDAEGQFEFTRVLPGRYVVRLASPGLAPEERITVSNGEVRLEMRTTAR